MTLFKKVFDSHFSQDLPENEQPTLEAAVSVPLEVPETANFERDLAAALAEDPEPDLQVSETSLEAGTRPDIEEPAELTMAQRAAMAHAQMGARRPAGEHLDESNDLASLRSEFNAEPHSQPQMDQSLSKSAEPPRPGLASRSGGRVKTRLLGFHQTSEIKTDPLLKDQSEAKAPPHLFPTGWLVVVEGPGEGNALPVFDGVSTIGRGDDQALSLDYGDTSISRQNHAAIAYDGEQNAFFLGHGGKSNIIRLNDRPVLSTEELNHADILRIGETSLRFVALCGTDFKWKAAESEF